MLYQHLYAAVVVTPVAVSIEDHGAQLQRVQLILHEMWYKDSIENNCRRCLLVRLFYFIVLTWRSLRRDGRRDDPHILLYYADLVLWHCLFMNLGHPVQSLLTV